MPLTTEAIDSLTSKGKIYRKYDSYGLFIEVSPKGYKWWRFRYEFDGKPSQISLGTYPKVSLDSARVARDVFLELLKSGQNPSKIKRENKLLETKKQPKPTTIEDAIFFAEEILQNLKYMSSIISEPEELDREIITAASISYECLKVLKKFFRGILKKVDLDKEIHKGMEHKFIIPIKDLEGTVLHPEYDWANHKYTFYCNEDDEEEY